MTLKYLADHFLGNTHDALFVHKRSFYINLGEFRLAVSAQILITKALGNLVVTIHACHHQYLLEQLR